MNPWPIAPLAESDLDFAVVNYGLADFTGNELSSLPSFETFIDSLLNDFSISMSEQAVLIASMDGIFDDMGLILDELAVDDFAQVLADLAGLAATGDSLLNAFSAFIG